MVEFGDRVKVGDIEGIFIKSDSDFNIIKLDSGYNYATSSKDKLKLISKHKSFGSSKVTRKYNNTPGKKNVLILHTGGTIASKVDYETGGVISRIEPEELLNMFDLMYHWCNFDTKLLSAMYSEDMRFDHYNVMAEEIKKASKNYDAVIITHGTDTMHYTSSALSFMFEDLECPVVLVGAQRSSDRGSSDAYINMAAASKFISMCDKSGVYICMHKNNDDNWCHILRGVNCKKMHTTFRSAFRPINATELANVNPIEDKIEFHENFKKHYFKSKNTNYVKLNSKLKIGFIYVHPNMSVDEFELYDKFDAVIVCSMGIGNVPINVIDDYTQEHKTIYNYLEKLSKKIPVVFASQTVYGRINQNVYTTGRNLKKLNIKAHLLDIIIETAFTKLAYLLSKNIDHNQVLELYETDLKGEIDTRVSRNTFLR